MTYAMTCGRRIAFIVAAIVSVGYEYSTRNLAERKNFIDVMWVALGHLDNVQNIAGKGYILKK